MVNQRNIQGKTGSEFYDASLVLFCYGILGEPTPSPGCSLCRKSSCADRFSGMIHLLNWKTLSQIRIMNSCSEFGSQIKIIIFSSTLKQYQIKSPTQTDVVLFIKNHVHSIGSSFRTSEFVFLFYIQIVQLKCIVQ